MSKKKKKKKKEGSPYRGLSLIATGGQKKKKKKKKKKTTGGPTRRRVVRHPTVGVMAVRLDESDEYMHELGPEPNFNESMYFNCYDPAQRVGGWFRMGNRANEGTAEMTVCLYLPRGDGGRGRLHVQAAGDRQQRRVRRRRAHLDMVEPFEELRVDYDGKVVVLDEPEQMANPKEAFTEQPVRRVPRSTSRSRAGSTEHVRRRARHAARGARRGVRQGPLRATGRGHGTIRVGEREWQIDGFGLRDHSWGPRYWQAPWYYRWLTANVDEDFGFMASRVAKRDGDGTRGGFVWENGEMHLCDDVEITTETRGDEQLPRPHRGRHPLQPRSDREWGFTGEVMNLIPLRNRRQTPDGEWMRPGSPRA